MQRLHAILSRFFHTDNISYSPRQFFVISDDGRVGDRGHGIHIVNERFLMTAGMAAFASSGYQGAGKPLPHAPILFQEKDARPLRDLEYLSCYWLVSEHTKCVFEHVDAQGFRFIEADFILADGTAGPRRYLCDVIRERDVKEEVTATMCDRIAPPVCAPDHALTASPRLTDDYVGKAHIFTDTRVGDVICDEVLRDACLAAGLTGTLFMRIH